MFRGEKDNLFEPVKIRRKEKKAPNPEESCENGEPGAQNGEEAEYEEDHISEEGAVWPIVDGRIVDWPCFYALMTHVYNTINPPFHTPVLLISQPVWTTKEHEKVTQFFFERFKIPAFAMMDAAMATSYAYGMQTAIVVDVGWGKIDITAISEFVVQDVGRALAVPDCGGEAMTQRLKQLLSGKKGFTRDVCEQLKKSPICEILAPDMEVPTATMDQDGANPASLASTGADGSGPGQRHSLASAGDAPLGPGPGTQVGEEKPLEDDEGVLDIASIVTSGNMSEYLAQKEREKADKLAARQKKVSDVGQPNAPKQVKMPNSKRARNTFVYEDFALHDAMKNAGMSGQGMAEMQSALADGPNKATEPASATTEKPPESFPTDTNNASASSPFRRELEVGPERFQCGSGGILERIADAVHRTVQSCSEVNRRSELWDSVIIVGNGSKVRGFKEALLATLNSKYLISPSSATIFTSELPSNLSTPMATGANTPQPQMHHQSSGVNPLLLAATTAQNPHLNPSSSGLGHSSSHNMHSSHAQTPTSIKMAKIPDYFPEWKDVGYDEAAFLGAQVAAKVLFVVDQGLSKGYVTRTDYNDQGPQAIHEAFM